MKLTKARREILEYIQQHFTDWFSPYDLPYTFKQRLAQCHRLNASGLLEIRKGNLPYEHEFNLKA